MLPDHAAVFPIEHSQDEREQWHWFISESGKQHTLCDLVGAARKGAKELSLLLCRSKYWCLFHKLMRFTFLYCITLLWFASGIRVRIKASRQSGTWRVGNAEQNESED